MKVIRGYPVTLTMAHSDQMYSFYPCNAEIGKVAEESLSENKSSEDALVPPELSAESERFDLEDPSQQVVPAADQQIAQPTVSSSSESLMDRHHCDGHSYEEIVMVRRYNSQEFYGVKKRSGRPPVLSTDNIMLTHIYYRIYIIHVRKHIHYP